MTPRAKHPDCLPTGEAVGIIGGALLKLLEARQGLAATERRRQGVHAPCRGVDSLPRRATAATHAQSPPPSAANAERKESSRMNFLTAVKLIQ